MMQTLTEDKTSQQKTATLYERQNPDEHYTEHHTTNLVYASNEEYHAIHVNLAK